MTTSKEWTTQADQILTKIVTAQPQPVNWNSVMKQMVETNRIKVKSANECCKRWCKVQNEKQGTLGWNLEQEELLLKRHEEIGNKWLQLTKYFPHRTEGFLKNQYYSIFRRAVRRVNKQIYLFRGNTVRPITRSIILKVLSVCEQKNNSKKTITSELAQAALKLKQILIQYSNPIEQQKQVGSQKVNTFLNTISQFRAEFKIKRPKVKKEEIEELSYQIIDYKIQNENQESQKAIQIHQTSLICSQPIYQKELQKSNKTLTSPSMPIIPHVYFPIAPIVETGGIIQQQIYPLPIASMFDPMSNKFFTVLKPVTLSLQDSMLFYENLWRRQQGGLQSSLMLNSNSNIKLHGPN